MRAAARGKGGCGVCAGGDATQSGGGATDGCMGRARRDPAGAASMETKTMMMQTRALACAAAGLALAGCAQPRAVIADIGEDKVIVQSTMLTDKTTIIPVAQEGCDLYGRKAQPISTREGPQYTELHLFACHPR